MLTLLNDTLSTALFRDAPPRLVYALGSTDGHSAERVQNFHKSSPLPALRDALPEIHVLPRARHVAQPALPSAIACARCFFQSWKLVGALRPDIVVTNGPATGAIVSVAAVLREALIGERCQVVYVESLARVRTLSLSGHVLYYVADRFLVQWPELAERFPRAEYYGRLC